MKESLIERVAKLRELEAKASSDGQYIHELHGTEIRPCHSEEYGSYLADFAFPEDAALYVALRYAAPAMLDILGEIRPGDAAMLQAILDDIHEREEYPGHAHFATECLRRYQAMASRMEALR